MVLRPDELQLSRGESVARHRARPVAPRRGDRRAHRPRRAARGARRARLVPVFNMLTAGHHPCQALADLLTLREAFGRARGPASSPTSATATTSRARSRWSARSPASRSSVASPDGLPARAGRPPARARPTTRVEAVAGAHAVYADVWVSMGDEETADERRARARALPHRRRAARPRRRPARSRCTACPRTPARRSPPRCSTAPASASGTRPRTAATRRRRCSSGWSHDVEAARPPFS